MTFYAPSRNEGHYKMTALFACLSVCLSVCRVPAAISIGCQHIAGNSRESETIIQQVTGA